MKKLILVCLIILSPCVFAKKKAKPVEEVKPSVQLVNDNDSASYALGVNIGTNLSHELTAVGYNMQLVVEGLIHSAIAPEQLVMSNTFAEEFLGIYMKKVQEKASKANLAEHDKFFAENRQREGVFETASGLQYQIIKQGEGAKPLATDKVTVHYEGTLLDGTVFDSSIKRGTPATFPLNQVIKGWTEGLQLMAEGARYVLYIPYNLGYGQQGAGKAIPPYSGLIFEVELIEIAK